MNSIVETMAEMMPSMNQEMVNRLPEMLIAVLTLVKSLTTEVEKIYCEKEMD